MHNPGWHLSSVRGLLTNPVYTGQVFGNRLHARPVERRRSALRPVGRGGESRRVNDPAEWIAVATVPAIVDREQFERVQERLAYTQRMARRNNRVHDYLLRGLVSCGHCRRACSGRHVWRGYDYYVCRTKTPASASSPGAHCPTRHIPGRPLEELVWRDLCEVLATPEMVVHARERARGGHWLPQEMQARRANLRRARAGLQQQIERLTEAYLAGVVPLGECERRRRDAEARLAALDGQERELTHDTDRQAEIARLAAHAEAFCRRVRQGLEQADFARKRELLELLIDRIVVTDETVEIRYVIPVGPGGERDPFCLLRTDYQPDHARDDDRRHRARGAVHRGDPRRPGRQGSPPGRAPGGRGLRRRRAAGRQPGGARDRPLRPAAAEPGLAGQGRGRVHPRPLRDRLG